LSPVSQTRRPSPNQSSAKELSAAVAVNSRSLSTVSTSAARVKASRAVNTAVPSVVGLPITVS
jgi:hypothetical protein